ncbi:MAG: hypothetical protein HOO06_04130 [Bdellovibrionaceae bacterium]|jgi:hypothetical protein|nr:hypothetical protein [Pseudobdellovibrionaceae bacterium]
MYKFLLILTTCFLLPSAFAEDSLTETKKLEMDSKAKMGWNYKLKFSSNIALSSSDNIIGQKSGDTKTLGLKINSGANLKTINSEWRNSAKINLASTKTPAVPFWVKSEDAFKYETIYLKQFENKPWLGPYVKASVEAPLLIGENKRDSNVEYQYSDGTSLGTKSTQRLTDGFRPMTTKESLGLFAKAIDSKTKSLEFRVGLGAIQVEAKDQLSLDDKDTTENIIELKQLNSYSDLGVEMAMDYKGQWNKQSSYSLSMETLTPLSTNKEDLPANLKEESSIRLTNVEIKFDVTTKVNEWLDLSYEYKASYQPKLLDEWQRQMGFVMSFSYAMF